MCSRYTIYFGDVSATVLSGCYAMRSRTHNTASPTTSPTAPQAGVILPLWTTTSATTRQRSTATTCRCRRTASENDGLYYIFEPDFKIRHILDLLKSPVHVARDTSAFLCISDSPSALQRFHGQPKPCRSFASLPAKLAVRTAGWIPPQMFYSNTLYIKSAHSSHCS